MEGTRTPSPQLISVKYTETHSVLVEMLDGFTIEQLVEWIKECKVWDSEGYYWRTAYGTEPYPESERVAKIVNKGEDGTRQVELVKS